MRHKVKNALTIVIILMIIGAFGILSITDYFVAGGSAKVAARVNGEKISWDAVDTLSLRVAQQYGIEGNPKMLQDQVRKALVHKVALLSGIKALGFRVGDEQVVHTLLKIPDFQEAGQFSKKQYLEILRKASYTDVGFRQELAQNMLLAQMEQGLVHSGFSLQTEVAKVMSLAEETRDIGYATVSAQQCRTGINVESADLQNFYDEHKTEFVQPEQVSLEYVELSIDDLAKKIALSPEAAKAYYQEHAAAYSLPERVQVRHILIAVPNPDAEKKAKTAILKVQEALKQGAIFSELARTVSNDPGSAKNGGDVGWFTRGQMVPEFEKIAFSLKEPGDISEEPVRTQFGYHLIQLVDRRAVQTRSFEEVRRLVEEQASREQAQALFAEKAATLAKLAFENVNTLAPIAEQLGLSIKETNLFDRQGEASGVAHIPEVIKAAFSEEVLNRKYNSVPIQVQEGTSVVIRVKKHQPTFQQSLEEVKNKIQEKLITERAAERAKEIGTAMIKTIQGGESPQAVVKQHGLQWTVKTGLSRSASDLDRAILTAAFQVSRPEEAAKNSVRGVPLASGEYVVLAVNKIKPGEPAKLDRTAKATYQKNLADFESQLEYSLYTDSVMKTAKVEFGKIPD